MVRGMIELCDGVKVGFERGFRWGWREIGAAHLLVAVPVLDYWWGTWPSVLAMIALPMWLYMFFGVRSTWVGPVVQQNVPRPRQARE